MGSSLQFTVNNLFGKNMITTKQQQHHLQPPVPPIPLPSMQETQTVHHEFTKPWNDTSQYFINNNGMIPDGFSMNSKKNGCGYHDVFNPKSKSLAIPPPPKRSEAIPIPFKYKSNHIMIASDGNINRERGLTNIPDIPLDGTHINTSSMHKYSTNIPQEQEHHILTMNEAENEEEETSDSLLSNDGNINDDTNTLFVQLKEARYYKPRISKSGYSRYSFSNKTKSNDHSMKTMIIKEENDDYDEFTNDEEEDDDNKTDGTRYTIKVTHPENKHEDDGNHVITGEEDTEYSFTENTQQTNTTLNEGYYD